MKFHIITPSFNQLDYLKRCVASVRDQISETGLHGPRVSDEALKRPEGLVENVGTAQRVSLNDLNGLNGFNESGTLSVHHHIQDGGSSDGTVDWLRQYETEVRRQQSAVSSDLLSTYTFSYSSERDTGMYDALNKGIGLVLGNPDNQSQITNNSRDSVIAWLNCDEQYLPGTLAFVHNWFKTHPEVDLLSGGALLTRPDGTLLAFRKAYPLRRCYIAVSHLYNLSCGMFFRGSVWTSGGRFDESRPCLADQDWVMRILKSGVRTGYTGRFFSAFCFTGANLSQTEGARGEEKELYRQTPAILRRMSGVVNAVRLMEKALRGGYRQPPFDYSVYTGDAAERKPFHVEKASFQWPNP